MGRRGARVAARRVRVAARRAAIAGGIMPPGVAEPRIAVLSPALADQIAAGEVVERAASVVKELCENAVDAEARRIDVDIDGGGRRSIRVVDDGGGMSPDEARLALRRHATSKIRHADDLWGLATFGFRGEALPSIAAVSRLTLCTKIPGALAGFRLSVEAGHETDARDVGIPDGTQIEVRDLFFNTPARLKFQKTEATEAANVTEAVLRLALGHPEVHFRLRAGGRIVLDLPVHRDLGERVRAAFARRGSGALHEAQGEDGGHRVRAFLAAPDEASSTARSTFLFVGRRFVRDRSLLHALSLGYGEWLEKGRYPLAALFVDVPAPDLDINVHPQKLEVRFARSAEVYAAVRHVVAAGVARAPWLPSARGFNRMHTLPPAHQGGTVGEPSGDGSGAPRSGFARPGTVGSFRAPGGRVGGGGTGVAEIAAGELARVGIDDGETEGQPSFLGDPLGPLPSPATGNDFFQSLTLVGQLARRYLVCETAGELVLVDQRAARECVIFERLRADHRDRAIARQRLLFPVPVPIDESLWSRVERTPDLGPALAALGFESEFSAGRNGKAGGGEVLVRAVPELLRDADPKPLIHDVLARWLDQTPSFTVDPAVARVELVLWTMASHGTGGAADVMSRPQAVALLAQLAALEGRSNFPHRRAVVFRLSLAEIERRFGSA